MKIIYHSNREITFGELKEGEAFRIEEELARDSCVVYFAFYDALQDKLRAINTDGFQAEDFDEDFVVIPVDVEINIYGIEGDEDEDE